MWTLNRLLIKLFVLSIFEWLFNTGFTVITLFRKGGGGAHRGRGAQRDEYGKYLIQKCCVSVIVCSRQVADIIEGFLQGYKHGKT